MSEDKEADAEFGFSPGDRRAAHQALDRWLDEAEREADTEFESGHSGYLGRIKLCAFVDDEGVRMRVERSFTRDL